MGDSIILHDPFLIGCQISIKTMGTHMIVVNICKFFYDPIKCFFRCKFIKIRAFIFQCVEISPHRCIIIRAACFTHFWCLAPFIHEKENYPFSRSFSIFCILPKLPCFKIFPVFAMICLLLTFRPSQSKHFLRRGSLSIPLFSRNFSISR